MTAGGNTQKTGNPLEHILYDMQMYLATWRMLQDGIAVVKNGISTMEGFEVKIDSVNMDIIWNSIVESHLMHLRNLIDFFSKKKGKNDTITCSSIMKTVTGEWYLNSAMSAKRTVNKAIAQLPALRTKQDAHSAEDEFVHAMIMDVSEKIGLFLTSLQPELLKTDAIRMALDDGRVRSHIADVRRRLEQIKQQQSEESKK
ncbi:MAG: hypothetical protein ACC608_06565 [Anaerofustis sp.]